MQVMRRQKTPQKHEGKAASEPATDIVTATLIVTDNSVAAAGVSDSVSSPALPSASVTVSAADVPLDAVNSVASAASAALPATDSSAKSKTPQTRKARSRIAANFGALNSPQS